MPLFDSTQLCKWRYNVAECIVKIGDEALNLLPLNVVGIEIHNNYFANTFPIFKLNLLVDETDYYKINANKTTLKIKLRIQKYYKKSENDSNSFKRDYINDIFVLADEEEDVNRDRDLSFQSVMLNTDYTNGIKDYNRPMELYLYKESSLTGMKQQVNVIFDSTNLSTAVGYILSKGGVKNVLMSPFENNKVYTDLLLPPLTINKQIAHLDACYGFYKQGSMIFFGIDRTYILNFKGGCTAWESGEKKETCFLIPNKSALENGEDGSIDKGDNINYIKWNYSKVGFASKSVTENVTKGSDALVVNSTDGSLSSSKSTVNTIGDATTAVIENKGGNPWMGSTYTAQVSSGSTILAGSIANFDADALTPNKNFSVIFEDTKLTNKYKGSYILSNCMLKFLNDTASGDFSIVGAIELRKMEKTSVERKTL